MGLNEGLNIKKNKQTKNQHSGCVRNGSKVHFELEWMELDWLSWPLFQHTPHLPRFSWDSYRGPKCPEGRDFKTARLDDLISFGLYHSKNIWCYIGGGGGEEKEDWKFQTKDVYALIAEKTLQCLIA